MIIFNESKKRLLKSFGTTFVRSRIPYNVLRPTSLLMTKMLLTEVDSVRNNEIISFHTLLLKDLQFVPLTTDLF